MRVVVNGEAQLLPDGTNVADVVTRLGARSEGTAVAVNGDVVPRSAWPAHPLGEGDRVEVLTAVQGG